MIIYQNASQHQSKGSSTFHVDRIQPGLGIREDGDGGFGPLGLVDHTLVQPGFVMPMHEHQNDEIFSYLRHGTVHHVDTLGRQVTLTSTNLVVMNAGSGIMHEETVPQDGEEVEGLQIFVRPRATDLKPDFQHHKLTSERSYNKWRLLAGPEDSLAPLKVRNAIWVYDTFLKNDVSSTGSELSLPVQEGLDTWLYVFRGQVMFNDRIMETGDSAALVGQFDGTIKAIADSDLVCFLVDQSAPASHAGTLSG